MNGWQEVPLGSLLTRIKDDVLIQDFEKYQRLTIRTNNKGIEIRDELEGHLIGTKNQYVVHGGQFLLSKIDAMNGAFGIVPEHVENGIITSNFWAYDVDEDKLFSKYFNYLTHTSSFQEFCIQASSGTTHRKYLREDLFLGMEIPLPPLTEQRRIVEDIESLARRVNEAQSLREEADLEATVLLDTAVGKVFTELEAREVKPLKDLATKIGSGSTPKGGRAIYLQSGIPFIRSMNVRMRQFQWSDIAYIDPDIHESMSGTKVKPRDVLLNITGASIGRVACAPDDLVEANVNQHVTIIRPIETLDYRFLMYWLSQPAIQDFINDEQKGATRQGFTKAQIEQFEIPILPLDEQRRIVAYLDGLQAKVNALRELQSRSGEELSALMASVLDRAFRGEL